MSRYIFASCLALSLLFSGSAYAASCWKTGDWRNVEGSEIKLIVRAKRDEKSTRAVWDYLKPDGTKVHIGNQYAVMDQKDMSFKVSNNEAEIRFTFVPDGGGKAIPLSVTTMARKEKAVGADTYYVKAKSVKLCPDMTGTDCTMNSDIPAISECTRQVKNQSVQYDFVLQ
ncbi:MAG: hypothetical protein GC201_06455 [Alphaproteobacteria bacterium]|nr:hypothetical protein [Alphaproteobacteria bacterium]